MIPAWMRGALFVVAASGLGLSAAMADVSQKLDSVDGVTTHGVLEMLFGKYPLPGPTDPGYETPLTATVGSGLSFVACQRSASRNLYCLLNSYTGTNGQMTQPVRRWKESGSVEDLFSCTDAALHLDGKKSNPCTSITVDLAGNIWLGGRDGTSYSAIKVVEVPAGASCEAGPLPDGPNPADPNDGPFKKLSADLSVSHDYCFRRYASGRPIIVDMIAVTDKLGPGFSVSPGGVGGPGVLLLEDRTTVDFVADPRDPNTGVMLDPLPPFEVASGKNAFGLAGNEMLQSLALLQLDCTVASGTCYGTNDKKVNYLLVTSSTGKVIAKRTDPLSAATPVFSTSDACSLSGTPQFWVRVSPQSGSVYVADRSCNVVRQLQPTGSLPLISSSALLSTAPAADSTNTLNTLSVSPGIGFDLTQCYSDDCVFVADNNVDGNQVAGAKMTRVQIEQLTGLVGLTAFRMTGIPDCRYISPVPDICTGAVVTVNGVPGFLDVGKLVPPEIKSLFNESTNPTLANLKLLISPRYRARPPCTSPGVPQGCVSDGSGNTFEALFGRTEDGSGGSSVVFRNTFDLTFDIEQLTGTGIIRCGFQNTDPTRQTPAEWDAVVTSSERYSTANDVANGDASGFNPGLTHSEMLVNTFCENPTAGSGDRWSLYAYGLMLTNPAPDAFATLMDSLFDELEQARSLTACTDYDGNGAAPISPSVCANLASAWANARDKLNKCIEATTQPKNSALAQNCQSFEQQWSSYVSTLDTADINWWNPPAGVIPDIANRVGEQKARVNVIDYIYYFQFLPSVPPGGFLP
jgi:hypothetical protein